MLNYRIIKDKLYSLSNILIVIYGFVLFIDYHYSELILHILILLWIMTGDFKIKYIKLKKHKIIFTFLSLIFLVFIGLLWTEDKVSGYHVISYISKYFITVIIITMYDKKYIKSYVFSMLFALIITGILTLLIKHNLISMSYNSDISPFINRVYLGIMLVFAYSYFLWHIKLNNNIIKNTILLVLSVLMIYTIIISGSRMAFINVIISTIIIFIYKFGKFGKFKITLFPLVFAILFSYLFYNNSYIVKHKVDRTILTISNMDLEEQIIEKKYNLRTSLTCRFEFWYYAYKLGNEYPLYGVGTGDSIYELKNLIGENNANKLFLQCLGNGSGQFNPHNMYIFMYMQFGILGLIILFYIIYTQSYIALKSKYVPFIILIFITIISMFSLTLLFTSKYFIPFYGYSVIVMYLSTKYNKFLIK